MLLPKLPLFLLRYNGKFIVRSIKCGAGAFIVSLLTRKEAEVESEGKSREDCWLGKTDSCYWPNKSVRTSR